VRIRVAEDARMRGEREEVGSIDRSRPTPIEGVLEGFPSAEDKQPVRREQGRLVRIAPDGRRTILWRSAEDAPFQLLRTATGQILFVTGEPARLYRLERDGEAALLVTLSEAQATDLLARGRSIFVGTSNPAALYRLDEGTADSGVYLSRPVDAGGPARWGSVRWNVEGDEERVEIYTRTGGSRVPDDTWSAWSPALIDPGGSAIVNPEGRFLQWRARFTRGGQFPPRLSALSLRYQTINRAPVISRFFLDASGRAISGEAKLRWTAYDPDNDPLEFTLEYRSAGASEWRPVPEPERSGDAEEGATPGTDPPEELLVWQTGELDEGEYRLRAAASDDAANAPGEGRTVAAEAELTVIVDRTPPVIEVRVDSEGRRQILVVDAHSDVERLEARLDGRTRYRLRPVDGVADSPRESFQFDLPEDPAEGSWSLVALDSAENAAEVGIDRP